MTYGKHSGRFLGPLLWSKLTRSDRSCTTLGAPFMKMIRRKKLGDVMDGCSSNCYLCSS